MSSPVDSCANCDRKLVAEAIYCPHCLINRVETKEEWLPISNKGIDNTIANHSLVPEHRVFPKERVTQLCREYSISRTDLPYIKETDPAIQKLICEPGDVIKVVRDSRTTDTAHNYRLVISEEGSLTTNNESSEWQEPAAPATTTFSRTKNLTDEQALHIIENLRAHIPPSQPGACRQLAIDRESEITTATERIESAEPYTFIQGELGYGKSFFLHWARDEVLPWTAASLIDLDDQTNFLQPEKLVGSFQTNLETPRSLDNPNYANGLDELWDTTLRKVADICASDYEREGFKVREDRMQKSIEMATKDILSKASIPTAVINEIAETTIKYFNSNQQSLSQTLLDEIGSEDPMDVLSLISELARLNGFRVLLGVDELEKSIRTEEHFEEINSFIDQIPENVSLFITGTPELVGGGKEGNALQETHRPLYEQTVNNRITLDAPTRANLIEFSTRIIDLETQALEAPIDREYTSAINSFGDTENATDAFLAEHAPAFRSYLDYLEQQ